MSDEHTLALPPQLTIPGAEALHQQLEALLGSGQPVRLDVSQVERVDTSGLQLLLALRAAAASQGGVHWQGHSAALDAAAKQLGLTKALALASTD